MKKLLLLTLLLPALSFGQTTADPAYANMQRAVGGIIQQNAVSRGFSVTDPRTYGTLYSAGKVAAAGAATAGAGLLVAGSAPAWGTVLAIAAVSGAVSYGVSLGLDGLVKWSFGGNSSAPVSVPGGSSTASNLVTGQPYVSATFSGGSITSSNTASLASAMTAHDRSGADGNYYDNKVWIGCSGNSSALCLVDSDTLMGNWGVRYLDSGSSYSGPNCSGSLVGSSCVSNPSGPSVQKSLADAIAGLTDSQKAQKVSYDTMALLINDLLQKAASQPDYVGLPVDASKPVTATQVQQFAETNPGSYPSVGAMVAPVSDSATGFSVATSPIAGKDPALAIDAPSATTLPPIAGSPPPAVPAIDWTVPGTGEQIPKLVVPVSFTPTIFAAPTGCPAPISFTVFDKIYAISYQPACDLMMTLAPIFLALGAATAALIFAESLKS